MARWWKYPAITRRIVDGDTLVADIDQGMNHWSHNQYVRFAGINAPERSTEEGKRAKAFTEVLLQGQPIWLITTEYHEFEKYGRVLAYVYLEEPFPGVDTDPLVGSVNNDLLASGNAVPYP